MLHLILAAFRASVKIVGEAMSGSFTGTGTGGLSRHTSQIIAQLKSRRSKSVIDADRS
jgi:hypothetical protein